MEKDIYFGINSNGNIEIINQETIIESIENMDKKLDSIVNYILSNDLIMYSKLHFLYKKEAYARLNKLIDENKCYSRRNLDEIGKTIRNNIYNNVLILFLGNYEYEKGIPVFRKNNYFGIIEYDKLVNKCRKENIGIRYSRVPLPKEFNDLSGIIYSHFNYERRNVIKVEDYYDMIKIENKEKVLGK